MPQFKHVVVLTVLTFLSATGLACAAAPLMGHHQSSLGFASLGLANLYRSF